jgi:hypothetical protein
MIRHLCVCMLCTACFQELDSGADSETAKAGASHGPTTAIEASALPIGITAEDEQQTTTDPCAKTRRDKTEILTAYCASCHGAQPAQGLPPWDFVLDDARLLQEVWARTGQPDQRFVIPGDPDHSALYVRAATDMPPIPTDVGTPRSPGMTASDLSVLRHWISECM